MREGDVNTPSENRESPGKSLGLPRGNGIGTRERGILWVQKGENEDMLGLRYVKSLNGKK